MPRRDPDTPPAPAWAAYPLCVRCHHPGRGWRLVAFHPGRGPRREEPNGKWGRPGPRPTARLACTVCGHVLKATGTALIARIKAEYPWLNPPPPAAFHPPKL